MKSGRYQYIKAFVDRDTLRWEYRLKGGRVVGKESFDDDVSTWTKEDIIKMTKSYLSVDASDPVEVEVVYL